MKFGMQKYRVAADSFPEITKPFTSAVARISNAVDDGPTGRKLTGGHVVNAILYWFVRLPEPVQVDLATYWMAELETLLAETDEERREAMSKLKAAVKPNLPDGLLGTADLTKKRPKA